MTKQSYAITWNTDIGLSAKVQIGKILGKHSSKVDIEKTFAELGMGEREVWLFLKAMLESHHKVSMPRTSAESFWDNLGTKGPNDVKEHFKANLHDVEKFAPMLKDQLDLLTEPME